MNTSPENQITAKTIPSPKKGCHLEEFDDELVLYDMESTQAIYLNETAALVFRLCDGKRTTGDIEMLLKEAYPEMADEIESDVRAVLDNLAAAGAVVISS